MRSARLLDGETCLHIGYEALLDAVAEARYLLQVGALFFERAGHIDCR